MKYQIGDLLLGHDYGVNPGELCVISSASESGLTRTPAVGMTVEGILFMRREIAAKNGSRSISR